MTDTIRPVILCGGAGTRLWPLSTPDHPKQFLPLTSHKPMIVETADRFAQPLADGVAFDQLLVVGAQGHSALLHKTLPNARFILEPFGRNSAPAIAAACLASNADDLLLILPADHSIKNVQAFQDAIAAATPTAKQDFIVTFGIEPTYPAIGYGYIKAKTGAQAALFDVEAFVEKPARDVAEAYLAEGQYYWNAGIFLFKASTMLAALTAHAPDIVPAVEVAMGEEQGGVVALIPDAFARAPDISIDYAVMEHASHVKVRPVDMGWSDVGDYKAIRDLFIVGPNDCVTVGPVAVHDAQRLYVTTDGPVVAASGVKDLVIVASDNTIMVTPMDNAAAIKSIGQKVTAERGRLGLSEPLIEETRDWLWQTLTVWLDVAWDKQDGGFVEQLALDGTPDPSATRRVRVQARQIYTFARTAMFGWEQATAAGDLAQKGLAYLDQNLRHSEGGWVHTVAPDARVVDARRDLYDHAFIILAAATAYESLKDPLALQVLEDAAAFVETQMRHQAHGGWCEALPPGLPRRANPHMHLLEAMMAWHQAVPGTKALQIAGEIVDLFEAKFFDPTTNIMSEQFEADWRPVHGTHGAVWEPGHHYEWATLLAMYDKLSGRDTLSWRRRLIRQADAHGRDPASGFALNMQTQSGPSPNANRRLWPQLEMFRSHLMHPGLDQAGSHNERLRRLMDVYLNWGPVGVWLDETDPTGAPAAKAVPASMPYHLVTAFAPLIG